MSILPLSSTPGRNTPVQSQNASYFPAQGGPTIGIPGQSDGFGRRKSDGGGGFGFGGSGSSSRNHHGHSGLGGITSFVPLFLRRLFHVEGWIQSTQRAAPVGPQEVPRTPRAGAAASVHDAPVPPSPPPPMSMGTVGREGPFDRPASVHSSHNLHSRQSSEQGHQQGANHARPLAFIKNMFGQPGNPNQLEDIPSEGGLTPSVAKLPMMSGNSHEPHPFAAQQGPHYPNRPMRPDSLVLSQSAYEIYPDASASQYGGRSGRRNGSGDDQVPPMPSDRHGRGSTGLGRRGSYGAMSSQGGLPLPSFYLPSEPGDSSLPGALPIGESVLASPLETRQPHGGLEPPRRGPRRPGSNFVVTNATHSDED